MNRLSFGVIYIAIAALVAGFPAYGELPVECSGHIPDYVLEGNDRMVLTEEAEKILCQADDSRRVWDGALTEGEGRSVIEDKIVSSAALAESLARGTVIEFRNSVFPDELYFHGKIKSNISFDKCEFRGNFDIHDAQFDGELWINRSILHQGVNVADSHFSQPLRISGSVLAGDFQIDNSSFLGGVRVSGVRLLGNLVANGLQSPVGLSFDDSRFLGSLNMTGLEIGGGVRFRECEWSERSLISFTRGTMAGGLRFDACGFESGWGDAKGSGVALVRLADVTIASSMVVADAKSKKFPVIRVSRCLIPFIKLPEWSIARNMVLQNASELTNERDMENSGELLQLVKKSYEAQGRTLDAVATRNAHRLMIARIKGQPTLGLRLALNYFGTGLWWFVGVVVFFAVVLLILGRRWGIVAQGDKLPLAVYKAIDLSLKSFIKGPPDEGNLAVKMSPVARRWLRVERVLGILFFLLLSLAMKEWLEG
jgi:hypothetical protein